MKIAQIAPLPSAARPDFTADRAYRFLSDRGAGPSG